MGRDRRGVTLQPAWRHSCSRCWTEEYPWRPVAPDSAQSLLPQPLRPALLNLRERLPVPTEAVCDRAEGFEKGPSVVLRALARHGVLDSLVEGEHGGVARYRGGIAAGQVREHIHDQVGIGQSFELAVDLVASRAGVVGLVIRGGSLLRIDRAPQRLPDIEEQPATAVTYRAGCTLLPDVEHVGLAVGQHLLLAGGARCQSQREGQAGAETKKGVSPGLLLHERLQSCSRPCGP